MSIFLIDFTKLDDKSIKNNEVMEMLIWFWTPKLSLKMITTHISSKLKRFDKSHVCYELTRKIMENVLKCENLHKIW